MKVCGVAMARLSGLRRTSNPLIDFLVNVGTIRGRPPTGQPGRGGGQVRCRLWAVGWGGGCVVVAGVTTRHRSPGEPGRRAKAASKSVAEVWEYREGVGEHRRAGVGADAC